MDTDLALSYLAFDVSFGAIISSQLQKLPCLISTQTGVFNLGCIVNLSDISLLSGRLCQLAKEEVMITLPDTAFTLSSSRCKGGYCWEYEAH